ncbi:uncharacterized protein N7487_000986 [Penicillium crustosum]|uniref:uncharacterized protein n=1 Tax=Penicillium crustosum TaxID=36656 RepID=UPI0023913310|nr:uncharacterized protein N7487_000986 [Penicillium crustosum]KAJ5417436.1 hypothetical protein N7487_000986 [Penicillium crustosum]
MPNTRRGEYDAAVVKKPLDPMRISSLLNDPDVCWQPRETSNIFGRVYTVTPKSTVQSGRTHSKQVQLSDLSHVSTKESGHISNHNGHSRRYSDEELWFIWYKRTVHRQQWDNILVDFNHQFPTRKRHHAETVQAAYYRSINRLRVHLGENISTESIIQHAKVSYSWMDIHSNQVQFSDLSTKESGHNSNHNGYYQRYNDEELWFIWYKRAVLCQHWDDVFVSFNRQFPNRQRDCVNGMRNKLNQEIREKRLPSRSQIQVQAGASHLDKVTSLITCANVSYPWMLEALETTQSSAGSDGMIENVSRLN